MRPTGKFSSIRQAGRENAICKAYPTRRQQPDIKRNLISAAALRDLLDDDRDGDLADYREGHNGGDAIANDPLVVDVRARWFYDFSHIPGAVWIAEAAAMGTKENEQRLGELLASHVKQGGKNKVVVYCHTGHTAGLVAGVLGTRGFNVKNLQYGFDIAWTGTQTAPAPIKALVEDKSASGDKPSDCG